MSVEIRKQMAQLCESRKTRTVGSYPDHPSKWRPRSILVPGSAEHFTDDSAWLFIRDCLLCDEIEVFDLILERPPGKKAWYMVVPISSDQDLYIKVHMGQTKVIGRSFHLSEPKGSSKDD